MRRAWFSCARISHRYRRIDGVGAATKVRGDHGRGRCPCL
ncbi:hypothetical protein GLE_0479 [Lysobacter enzymogenes]|uniref:Uncharacterized protein n=1 Tax=Lysobacter enzymogenes TaxID=69 RepID=A0A0S2DBR0_LYSEN|nr:hypothetical protein GLE_0479 [Lysobacter enzymogenes]